MTPTTVSYDPEKVDYDMTEIMEWLFDNFGYGVLEDTDAWRLDIRWSAWINQMDYHYMIEFRNPEDAMLFNMRWV